VNKIILMTLMFAVQSVFADVNWVHDGNFTSEVLNSKIPVIVKTFTPWCGACNDMAPTFTRASQLMTQYKFVEINLSDNAWVRQYYKVKLVPTILMFLNGNEVYRYTGVLSSSQLESLATKYLK
jgi:thioredoxin 2